MKQKRSGSKGNELVDKIKELNLSSWLDNVVRVLKKLNVIPHFKAFSRKIRRMNLLADYGIPKSALKKLNAFPYGKAAIVGCAIVLCASPVLAEGAQKSAETEEEESEEESGIRASFGVAKGVMGDRMITSFLNFTLNSAAVADSYQSITADEGMQLLVLNITTEITQDNDLMLYDTDYQIQWGGQAATDYSEPITYRDEWADFTGYKQTIDLEGITSLFPGEAALTSEESVTYDYVYQVPSGITDFQLMFKEFFADESLGDLFIVSFHPDSAGRIEGTLGEIDPASGYGHVEVIQSASDTSEEATGETTGEPAAETAAPTE